MAEWIKVEDGFPEEGDSVLLAYQTICQSCENPEQCMEMSVAFYDCDGWNLQDDLDAKVKGVAWQPLPEYPL